MHSNINNNTNSQINTPQSMKSLFPGHYKISDNELRELWSKALFVFDANVLLNFYRYSSATRASFIIVLKNIGPRIWLPHQSALEFHRNRLSVVATQTASYEEAKRQTEQLLEKLKSPWKHPFVSDQLMTKTEKCLTELISELSLRQSDHEKLLHDDPGLIEITDLFHDRIGLEPSPEAVTKYCDLASKRIQDKSPPGYKDQGKDGNRETGDAILWLQTLDHAASVRKPVIFVTDDAKEDWWVVIRGQTVGPRPELVKEFINRTGNHFHMYQPSRFVEYAGKYLNQKADPAMLEEVSRLTSDNYHRSISDVRKRSDHGIDYDIKYVNGIFNHIEIHTLEISNFISIVHSMPLSEWEIISHHRDLPYKIRTRIAKIVNDCPCVCRIASQIKDITAPGFNAISDQLEDINIHERALLIELRQLPDAAVKIAESLLNINLPTSNTK